MNQKIKSLMPCFYAFITNGMMALMVGAILPYLREEAQISYSTAGGFLSIFAIGNFLASFVYPAVALKLGRRWATVGLSALIPLFLSVMTFLPPISVMYLSFLMIGVGRGSISIVNNMMVNEMDGRASTLNILHTMFAIGAFISPFLSVMYLRAGMNWRMIVYTIVILSVLSSIWLGKLSAGTATKKWESGKKEKLFVHHSEFYIVSIILFFYLGAENCINGWFVTYFKESGIMSDAYATNLVSITWLLIMLGRLFNAHISQKISKQKLIFLNCICATLCFVLLISTHNLIFITIAVSGLGFFFAGIYPTCIANAGEYIKGSTAGMSLLLAIAALGGIIMPQIVGVMADYIGISGGIGFLSVSVLLMAVFSTVNLIKSRKDLISVSE